MNEILKTITNSELIIWIIFLSLFLFQIIYYLNSYWKLLFYKSNNTTEIIQNDLPPVSIIVCAKNEAYNLSRFLPLLLEQDYPAYEVIVVNDCSEDDSEDILQQFAQKYPHLYFTNVKQDPIYRHGKKLAISLGIKAAKHEHLLLTDADCYPTSNKWIRCMVQHFRKTNKLVLGISPYEYNNDILGKVIAYETLQTTSTYTSSALRKKPYMGVGRNLAYTKSLFYGNNGFSGHTHLLSGDDDLFVNKAATKDNVAVELSSESIIKAIPPRSWNEFFKQKRRHMSTGKMYKNTQKFRFVMESLLNFTFYALLITLLILCSYPLIALGIYLLRYIIMTTYRAISAKKMHFENSFLFHGIWLDIVVPVIRTYMLLSNIIKPQRFTWR